jgi:hypothetical protein
MRIQIQIRIRIRNSMGCWAKRLFPFYSIELAVYRYCISDISHRLSLNVVRRWWRLPGGTWTHWNPLWTSRSDSYSTSWPTLGNTFVWPISGYESVLNFYAFEGPSYVKFRWETGKMLIYGTVPRV